MNLKYQKVVENFNKLSDTEKITSIIEFIDKTIISLNKINKDIGENNEKHLEVIENQIKIDNLDIIYEKLHQLVTEIEIFSDKVSQEFYE